MPSVILPVGLHEDVLEPGFQPDKVGPPEDHQFQPAILEPTLGFFKLWPGLQFWVSVVRVKSQGGGVARYKLVANLW